MGRGCWKAEADENPPAAPLDENPPAAPLDEELGKAREELEKALAQGMYEDGGALLHQVLAAW